MVEERQAAGDPVEQRLMAVAQCEWGRELPVIYADGQTAPRMGANLALYGSPSGNPIREYFLDWLGRSGAAQANLSLEEELAALSQVIAAATNPAGSDRFLFFHAAVDPSEIRSMPKVLGSNIDYLLVCPDGTLRSGTWPAAVRAQLATGKYDLGDLEQHGGKT